MNNIENCSGNIKLRLPKSLHALLLQQSQQEGVSLNQLCLMYLSNGIGRYYLGTEEFNHRMELIANECIGNDELLFMRLNELNEEIERIKPNLLYELKSACDSGKRQLDEFIEVLRYIYPVYHGERDEEKLPMLKIPSAKIVIRRVDNTFIDEEEIKNIAKQICDSALVSYGDYDFFVPIDYRRIDVERTLSIVINVLCEYSEVQENIYRIRDALVGNEKLRQCKITIKPCYLGEYTGRLLNELYDKN